MISLTFRLHTVSNTLLQFYPSVFRYVPLCRKDDLRDLLQPDDTHLAVGMSNGAMSVSRRIVGPAKKETQVQRKAPRAATYRFFTRGYSHKPNETDFRVEHTKKKALQPYDLLLKQFKYYEALDCVIEVSPVECALVLIVGV